MKFSTKNKILLSTFLASILNLKIFLLLSNYEQILQIHKYANNFIDFSSQTIAYLADFILTVPGITLGIYIVFSITVSYFWYTYFLVYFNRLPDTKLKSKVKYKILANIFTFIGFGCVACGQTLLYSILLFFGSNSILFFGELIGNLAMVLGIILLTIGIFENKKIYKNKNICKI
jgi:hypothetical protein